MSNKLFHEKYLAKNALKDLQKLDSELSENTQKLPGKLFLIIGPSGVGKGTLIEYLRRNFDNLQFVLSATTRMPRPGEQEGDIYHFISKAEFEEGIEQGIFLEWACVHQENYYGILKYPLYEALKSGKFVLREVDMQGFKSIKKLLPDENVISIFLKPESKENLLDRINRRSKLPEAEIAKRLESAKNEMAEMHLTDYQMVSYEGDIERFCAEVASIFREEMMR